MSLPLSKQILKTSSSGKIVNKRLGKMTKHQSKASNASTSSRKSLCLSDSTQAKFSLIDHKLNCEEVTRKYKTNIERGLSSNMAKELLARNGFNQLTPPKRTSELVKFFKLLTGGFSLLLWAGAILCFVAFCIDKYVNHTDAYDNVSYFFYLYFFLKFRCSFT